MGSRKYFSTLKEASFRTDLLKFSKMNNKAFEGEDEVKTNGAATYAQNEASLEQKPEKGMATKPYAGMGKEDLLRFSQTPFWKRLRLACLVIFWFAWLGLLTAVITLTVILPRCKSEPENTWWQTGNLYQIYVRSFKDSNGDGIGDINGITNKLDYLKSINTDAVILSSFYKGQAGERDFGYELTDHKDVDPIYGTLEDFDIFLKKAHNAGIKVVIDFVPNYTGDQHSWFLESKKTANISNPYWNYYVWTDCTEDLIPNNWKTVYGDNAWTYVEERGQCYLHQFQKSQPELDMHSTGVQEEMRSILTFWLDRGVDGFRVNVPSYLYENTDLTNDPILPDCSESNPYNCLKHDNTRHLPEVYDQLRKWNSLIKEYATETSKLFLAGTYQVHDNITTNHLYYGDFGQLPVYYGLRNITSDCDGECAKITVHKWIDNTYLLEDGRMWATASQDISRNTDHKRAILQTMLSFTLPGTPVIYYGQEIGMANANMTGRTSSYDPLGDIDMELSRDQFRSPMQWDNATGAGFVSLNSTTEPWLPVNDDFPEINVENELENPLSMLSLHKILSQMREQEKAFYIGDYHQSYSDENIFSFVREFNGQDSFLVAMNFGKVSSTVDYRDSKIRIPLKSTVYFSTNGAYIVGAETKLDSLTLAPGEGVIVMWPYTR